MIATSALWSRRLARSESGIAATELALVMPLVVVLIIGIFQVGFHIFLHQNLNATTARMGDLVTQEEKLSPGILAGLMKAVEPVSHLDAFDTNGIVIVSAVTNDHRGVKQLSWQVEGAGSLSDDFIDDNKIGAGGVLQMPAGFAMGENETVIVVDLFYQHSGFFTGPTISHKRVFNRGRIQDLANLES